MAMQTGMGLQKILMLAGLGYTGTILIKDGKLPEILKELQSLIERLTKSGEQDGEYGSDAVADQVRRLAMELRQVASNRQITVLNGNSGGNATSLVIPAATLGALGYGYMWWKGLSFSDLMYVTKKSMATAVSNLTKHLESVTDALSVAKKHLTQRILDLNDKVEKQGEISKDIRKNVSKHTSLACFHLFFPLIFGWQLEKVEDGEEVITCFSKAMGFEVTPMHYFDFMKQVEEACEDLFKVEHNLKDLQNMIYGLDGKIDSLGYKQDITNIGMYYLCNFVDGGKGKMSESMQNQLKLGEKARHLLKAPGRMGLKEISDSLSGTICPSAVDSIEQDGVNNFDEQQRLLLRGNSALY